MSLCGYFTFFKIKQSKKISKVLEDASSTFSVKIPYVFFQKSIMSHRVFRPTDNHKIGTIRPIIQLSAHPQVAKRHDYRAVKIIGKGAFGVVYIAKTPDGRTVAIKKVLQDPHYKNREYSILNMINNQYCIKMIDSFRSRGKNAKDIYLNIVMDFMPQSLHDFNISFRNERKQPPIIMIKLFAYQMFCGLNYIHGMGITHRDMKPQNILVDQSSGILKICDFGSAKQLTGKEPSVSYIASRFYRAPELMYNCQYYTNKIDIWAAGCIICECLLTGIPIFRGRTSIGQLHEIARIIGQPKPEDLLTFKHDNVDISSIRQITTLKERLPAFTPPDILDLISSIFKYDPTQRPTALECMKHPCFDELFQKIHMLPNNRPFPPLERDPKY